MDTFATSFASVRKKVHSWALSVPGERAPVHHSVILITAVDK